ncbi:unnamed protein product [Choristocarpus tenellus]
MGGLSGLKDDILVLVEKYGDISYAEDFLNKLAENARLMAMEERIRYMHSSDPFDLFSEMKDMLEPGEPLPDNVKHMLSLMRVKRFDKVQTIGGYSSIDATVEFFEPTGNAGNGVRAIGVSTTNKLPVVGKMQNPPPRPVHLHFAFRREQTGNNEERESGGNTGQGVEGEDSSLGTACPKEGCCSTVAVGGRKRKRGKECTPDREQRNGHVGGESEGEDSGDSEEEGLRFYPQTIVSYAISGGIAYGAPVPLLQAVIYARGDSPAPEGSALSPAQGELPMSQKCEGTCCPSEGDITDCEIDTEALEKVGRALGLFETGVATRASGTRTVPEEDEAACKTKDQVEKSSRSGLSTADLVNWLLLFPCFETEWDMVGIVASSIFDNEGDESGDEMEDDSNCEESD